MNKNNKMKNIILIVLLSSVLFVSCNKFLDETPQGVVSSEDLNSPENIEKLVVGAYSSLGIDHFIGSTSMWPQGSVRSGDAYKGGAEPNDQAEIHFFEVFTQNRVDNGHIDGVWFRLYQNISRANDALSRLNNIDEADFEFKKIRQAEMRFLRGHFYFQLKTLFKYMPYIDETTPKEEYKIISNREYSNDELWNKIADDFRFASDNLPPSQAEVGRANKFAAKAYLAKTLLFQAYKQDEKNQVISIDNEKLNEVVTLTSELENKYQLHDDFAKNFLSQFENGSESIFAIQYSKDDATAEGRLDWGHKLNYPMNEEYGCCGFHQPSQNMVNAFKTSADGLPMFTTYNNKDVKIEEDFKINTFDPRLDHTVAIPGHPYKYIPNFIFQKSWIRSPQIYGSFMSMKETVGPDDPAFQKAPPFMSSSKNWDIIRYDDVLLWKAEALIELDKPMEALELINKIRRRAAESTSRLKQADGTYSSNYKIEEYRPGVNCTWTREFAREALRWERRLEFSMEGNRFFDLTRWGIAAEYLNDYFAVEKAKSSHLKDAFFTKGRDEYFPIPLAQMNLSSGLYIQNVGW